MTLRCVPVEPTDEMLQMGWIIKPQHYAAMLAAAPPPPADIAKALEWAKQNRGLHDVTGKLARALLASWGRE